MPDALAGPQSGEPVKPPRRLPSRRSRALEITSSAERDIERGVVQFRSDLISAARRQARSDGVSVVSPIHAKRALEDLHRPTKRDRRRQPALAGGMLLLGVVAPLAFTAVVSPGQPVPGIQSVLMFILGGLGAMLVTYSMT